MHLRTVVAATAIGVVNALPTNNDLTARSQTLDWQKCTIAFPRNLVDPPPLPYECASLTVPFDYTDRESSEALELDLVRVKAINGTSEGNIVFNPGGPGGSGIEFLVFAAAELHEILGGGFDLISFDPRGTGKTIPFDCNVTAAGPLRKREYPTVGGNLSELIATAWDENVELAQACAEQTGRNGSVVGTTFTARDMAILADALDEDGMLNYWGISYGTYLGTVFATLYPQRVGKFMLDSNLNPYNWRAGNMIGTAQDADKAYVGFLSNCLEAPQNCSLAEYAPNGEVDELVQVVNGLAEISPESFATMKILLFSALYSPADWSLMTELLVDLFFNGSGEFTEPIGNSSEIFTLPPYNEGINALQGIACSDSTWRADSAEDMLPWIELQQNDSSFADSIYPRLSWPCTVWEITPKESYAGDFGGQTKNPILVANGLYDPVTPLAHARNVSAIFENSVLLQHTGYGHGVISHPSLCTGRAIRRYFQTGELPDENTVCEPDLEPFELESDFLDLLGGASRRKRSEPGTYTEDDVKLLKAMRNLGKQQNRNEGLPVR